MTRTHARAAHTCCTLRRFLRALLRVCSCCALSSAHTTYTLTCSALRVCRCPLRTAHLPHFYHLPFTGSYAAHFTRRFHAYRLCHALPLHNAYYVPYLGSLYHLQHITAYILATRHFSAPQRRIPTFTTFQRSSFRNRACCCTPLPLAFYLLFHALPSLPLAFITTYHHTYFLACFVACVAVLPHPFIWGGDFLPHPAIYLLPSTPGFLVFYHVVLTPTTVAPCTLPPPFFPYSLPVFITPLPCLPVMHCGHPLLVACLPLLQLPLPFPLPSCIVYILLLPSSSPSLGVGWNCYLALPSLLTMPLPSMLRMPVGWIYSACHGLVACPSAHPLFARIEGGGDG